MRLWLLRPVMGEWRMRYDVAMGFVVRASDEQQARRFATGGAGDEGRNAWLDPTAVRCIELTADGEPGIVIVDFNAG